MLLEVNPPGSAGDPTFGLLAAVGQVPDEAGWEHGVYWRGEGGGLEPQLLGDPCDEPSEVPGIRGRSYTVAVPTAFRMRDFWQGMPHLMDAQRVVREAQAATSAAVARELWTGEGTRLRPFAFPTWLGGTEGGPATEVNPYLTDGNAAVIGGVFDANEGIAALEEVARQRSSSTVPIVLHVPPRVAQLAAAELTRVGNTLRTASGSVVVADAGYAGHVQGFATGPIAVRLGSIVESTSRQETVLTRRNARETWAVRTFLVSFDPALQVQATFDLTPLSVTEPGG